MTDRTAMGAVSLGALTAESRSERTITVSLEWVVYAALIAFALLLRLAELDSVPMSAPEVLQALSAYRTVMPGVTIEPALTASPLLEALQSISFGVLGGSEIAARVMTVFGSLALILSPLLFRSLLGRGRTFILSLMLAVSPVLFAASRSSSPVVWTLLLVIVGLWGFWRFSITRVSFVQLQELTDTSVRPTFTRGMAYGVVAITAFVAAALLSEPGGIPLVLVVIAAGVLVRLTSSPEKRGMYKYEESQAAETSGVNMDTLRALPWAAGIGASVLLIVLITTGFVTQPEGLSGIGEVLSGFLGGISNSSSPAFLPIAVTLFYELFTVLFAIAAVIASSQRGADDITRFLIGWVALAAGASALWRGAGADHALWLVIPLTILASHAVSSLLGDLPDNHLWRVPAWGRWVVALGAIAITAVFTLALHDVARSLIYSPDGLLNSAQFTPEGVVLTLIPILFLIITYFLIASIWGDRASLQGLALGLFIFGVISVMGSGWRAAVERSSSPNELYHDQEAVSRDVWLMRETLLDLTRWGGAEFNNIEVRAVAEPDSVVAWILRDFPNATYHYNLQETLYAPIIITPDFGIDILPEITANYVGQDFIVRTFWEPSAVYLTELPGWWTQNLTRIEMTSAERVIVWVRSDVYAGTQVDEDTGAAG